MLLRDRTRLTRLKVDHSAGGTLELVAAATGEKVKVMAMCLTLASPTTLDFKSASTSLTGPLALSTINLDPLSFVDMEVEPWFQTTAGEALNLTFGAAVRCTGIIFYVQE